MTSVLDLARPDLRRLRPYSPGAYEPGLVRLNANESPWRLPSDKTERGLNIYPPPRPQALLSALSDHYGAAAERMLVTRGSSEAIDVLIRGFCRAGQDRILICPPTFDMYRVYATIQDAGITRVPLDRSNHFAVDPDAVLAAVDATTKIVFICTPNNPTGGSVAPKVLDDLAEELAGRALLVIDEAYHEFADRGGRVDLCLRHDHVVLLRTLSKFVALAGVRCGSLIGAPELVQFLGTVLPPYTFPTPSIELVLEALKERSLIVARERVALIRQERENLAELLHDVPEVLEVFSSDANFLLVRVRNGEDFSDAARQAGILVRRFPDDPMLEDCIRITIGRPEDNDRLLKAVAGMESSRAS